MTTTESSLGANASAGGQGPVLSPQQEPALRTNMTVESATPDAGLNRLVLRRAVAADAEACGLICYEAFKTISEKHAFPPDFPATAPAVELLAGMFTREDIYTVVAELDGRVVGSNALWENAIIAGVGPITVDPATQNIAVGRQLMQDVMQRARGQGFAGVRLVQAAYHSRSLSLYTKLGFDTREPLSVMQGPALDYRDPGRTVRAATPVDQDACNQLYRRIHGFERGQDLADAIAQGSATVVEHAGRITGYATMIGFFGHAAGETNEDMQALIGAAPEFPGPGFLLPTRNAELLRWCLARGLRIVQPMTLMSVGLYQEPQGSFMPSVLF